MVDMKMNQSEMEPKSILGDNPEEKEQYPYGLQIRLEGDQLKKLGISQVPKVGSYLNIKAQACVCSVTQSESEGEAPRQCVMLQIEQMEVAKGQEDAGQKLYGE